MEKRTHQGDAVSLLGFGLMRLPMKPGGKPGAFEIDYEASEKLVAHAMAKGINYFDTAYTYGGSEAFAGYALSRYPRESYFLATKLPPWMIETEADMERIFEEQLERCKTDYFDFYLVHNLARESNRAAKNEEFFARFRELGIYDMLRRKKAEGKIRRLGFSYHGTMSLLRRLASEYEWDFAQIQLNYVDWTVTDAKTQYEILTENNIPIVVMEPLRGGALATLNEEAAGMLKAARPDASVASWAMRYAASLPNVVTVLSGMNAIEQIDDNCAAMDAPEPIGEDEYELLDKAAKAYASSGAIPCTGCRYCVPCPVGVDIPSIFSIYNHYLVMKYRIPFDNGYSTLDENEKASACAQCGQCEEKCPQRLTIPKYLKEIDDFVNEPH